MVKTFNLDREIMSPCKESSILDGNKPSQSQTILMTLTKKFRADKPPLILHSYSKILKLEIGQKKTKKSI